MPTVGDRLRDLRENIKKTQTDLAGILGTTQQIYSNYELGKCDIPIRHLLTLAELYNVSTDYILGRVSYEKLPSQLSETFIQKISVGDLVCKVTSFNDKSKRLLIDYVNYLTFLENSKNKTQTLSGRDIKEQAFQTLQDN